MMMMTQHNAHFDLFTWVSAKLLIVVCKNPGRKESTRMRNMTEK